MEVMDEDRIFRIRRNLSDAGCSASQIVQFLELEEQRKRQEQYQMLSRQRALLLKELHQDQFRIDCLDYMVFTMQKEDAE
ncbi:MAG TPA: hypothetical protein H9817_10145 [Candidatus Mediterraneibacter stercorigallinarum]|uniref:Uncharacterized protein n=1 Tax=Candidatus Mediterraneibacter stercorigallinarum TaxID=2838686 RepID=A0A9D2DC20_9FIRM|nr:hypothetical protein [Candidatus Mediterraneibacter stercorigallinarum]